MGRPSENLTHDIKVRVDDELNSQIEKYAVKCTLSKAAAIREILSSFLHKIKRYYSEYLGNNNKLWFIKLICQSIIKVWSTFSKVVGVGKAHKYFPFMQSNDSQTARCLHLINCCIGRFYGRCPNPQFLKKLSKLFCFWEDNLALAKFQCPTDTPPNHNSS